MLLLIGGFILLMLIGVPVAISMFSASALYLLIYGIARLGMIQLKAQQLARRQTVARPTERHARRREGFQVNSHAGFSNSGRAASHASNSGAGRSPSAPRR